MIIQKLLLSLQLLKSFIIFEKLIKNIKDSYRHIPYSFNHYLMVLKLQKQLLGYYKYKFHDLDKIFLYIFFPFLGTKKISKIHRRINRHHIEDYKSFDKINFDEAIIDFESARYTKSDKPLNARETVDYYFKGTNFYNRLIEEINKLGL